MNKIDARGLSCPSPVLLTKKEIDKGIEKVEILADNNTAKNNIERFLKNSGFTNISSETIGDDIIIKADK